MLAIAGGNQQLLLTIAERKLFDRCTRFQQLQRLLTIGVFDDRSDGAHVVGIADLELVLNDYQIAVAQSQRLGGAIHRTARHAAHLAGSGHEDLVIDDATVRGIEEDGMAGVGIAHRHSRLLLNIHCQGRALSRQGVVRYLCATGGDEKGKDHIEEIEKDQHDGEYHAHATDHNPVTGQFVLEHTPAVTWPGAATAERIPIGGRCGGAGHAWHHITEI